LPSPVPSYHIGDWKSRKLGEIGGEKKTDISKDVNEEKKRMATLMLAKSYPIEEIILLTGLSEEEIKRL
jgi:hypothetical protein